jgi:hypothetical protein
MGHDHWTARSTGGDTASEVNFSNSTLGELPASYPAARARKWRMGSKESASMVRDETIRQVDQVYKRGRENNKALRVTFDISFSAR